MNFKFIELLTQLKTSHFGGQGSVEICCRFVLMHLPGKITYKEIDEMIHTVDKNKDGKISYSEFRVGMTFMS